MLDQRDIGLTVANLYDAKAQFLEAKQRYPSPPRSLFAFFESLYI